MSHPLMSHTQHLQAAWSMLGTADSINWEFIIVLTGYGLDLLFELSMKKQIKSIILIAWDMPNLWTGTSSRSFRASVTMS